MLYVRATVQSESLIIVAHAMVLCVYLRPPVTFQASFALSVRFIRFMRVL